jgi:hypothetical protein
MTDEATKRLVEMDKAFTACSVSMTQFDIIPPVRNPKIRHDSMGSGDFMASRGNRRHPGIDIEISHDGEEIIMPLKNAIVIREFFPYPADTIRRGVEVGNDMFICRIHYVQPDMSLIGKEVAQGEVIGHAQDIREKYGHMMKMHVHFECLINLGWTLPC